MTLRCEIKSGRADPAKVRSVHQLNGDELLQMDWGKQHFTERPLSHRERISGVRRLFTASDSAKRLSNPSQTHLRSKNYERYVSKRRKNELAPLAESKAPNNGSTPNLIKISAITLRSSKQYPITGKQKNNPIHLNQKQTAAVRHWFQQQPLTNPVPRELLLSLISRLTKNEALRILEK